METNIRRVDVLVIGGGVVGCAILRELSRYDVAVALLERSPDICEGTSKSNSAIVHTGFDAPPGSLEARLLAEARDLWPNVVDSLHIPYLQTGALMVATSEEELNTVETEIIPKAQRNGVILQRLSREEILANAPYVNPDSIGGVLIAIVEEDHGVSQIILPVPDRISKGILVTPIVFGGVLLGPTAEEVVSKTDLSTTAQGLQQIRDGIRKLVPVMAEAATVRQFAGLRAVSSTGDYIIRPSTVSSRMLHVAGIRSTGLSASPAIGRYAASLVRDELSLLPRSSFMEELPEYLTNAQPDEGDIVCLCRSITRGEVLAALRSPLPPTTLDSLKRRTGVMLGDCQGNLCMPCLIDLFQQQLGRDPLTLDKNVAHSSPIAGRVSNLASEPVNLEAPLLERRNGLNG
jgi:L-2-hydroxyglutarate oxidase LhgO